MPENQHPAAAEFIAFFDEAGDPGVKTVAPIDPNGASEWFILSCAVIRTSTQDNIVALVKEIKTSIRSNQRPDLHFRHLSEHKKKIVCSHIAAYPIRLFVLCSNKKNMRGYRNINAEAVSLHPNNWFYNHCIRILLERVTDWVERRSFREFQEPRHVRLVFSRRGGHSYSHVKTYAEVLQIQNKQGRLYQTTRIPKFSVIDPSLIDVIQHEQSAGCQIADIVASAFYQAVHTMSNKWTTSHAEALKPRIASLQGIYVNEGVTLLPWNAKAANLTPDQGAIFRFYGYDV